MGNMRRSKCGGDNRQGRKFCTNCGTSLIATCPKCGAAIQPEEKFCGECGGAIGASMPAPSSAQPSALQLSNAIPATEVIDGERKTVTALFADLKGSTELMEDLDPEQAPARLAEWLSKHRGPTAVSNQATDRIVGLYGKLGFKLRIVEAPRMINCTGDRSPAKEVLATSGLRSDGSRPNINTGTGGAEQDRTADLLNAIQALSQTELQPHLQGT
jgi:hypothetical protein